MTDLPLNREAEEAVVASLLHAPAAVHQLGFLRESDFADKLLGAVYGAIHDLGIRGRPTSWQIIAGLFEGRAEKAGSWLQAIMHSSAMPELVLPDLARSVRDMADRRRLMQIAEDMSHAAALGDRPAAEIAAEWAATIAGEIGDSTGEVLSTGEITAAIGEGLKRAVPVSSTGFRALDNVLAGGLYAGKLYGIVARKKVGKTTLMSSIAYNVASEGAKALYLPLEMGAEEIVQRIAARRMGVNSLAFLNQHERSTGAFIEGFGRVAVALQGLPLYFQARPRLALDAIRQIIARAAMRDGIKGVFIDYLQLITGQQKNQSQAGFLDEVTQALAEACKSWGVWIMVAAQENQLGNVRSGEGLLLACDMALRLHAVEQLIGPQQTKTLAWLEMLDSRYTSKRDVGSDEHPALMLDTRAGPAFTAAEAAPEEDPNG